MKKNVDPRESGGLFIQIFYVFFVFLSSIGYISEQFLNLSLHYDL